MNTLPFILLNISFQSEKLNHIQQPKTLIKILEVLAKNQTINSVLILNPSSHGQYYKKN